MRSCGRWDGGPRERILYPLLDRRGINRRLSVGTLRETQPVPPCARGFSIQIPVLGLWKTQRCDASRTRRLYRAVRYQGFQDYRGGGHFSGRITAPLVFAGAVCKQILSRQGIFVGSHIAKIHGISDDPFDPVALDQPLLSQLTHMEFPVLNKQAGEEMKEEILKAKGDADSVGGVIEAGIVGIPAGIGDPFFDSVESVLSHLLFSVPAVKGVSFGLGFEISDLYGSQSNDSYYMDDGQVKTRTNHNGGILGGITNGMPVVFRVAIKPTASIGKQQQSVNLKTGQDEALIVTGRHDRVLYNGRSP